MSTLARRITRMTTAVVVGMLVVVGGSSLLMLQELYQRGLDALQATELRAQAGVLTDRLRSIDERTGQAARNSVIATALVDSAGKDAYLVPFLQGLRRIDGIPVALVFVDFEGAEIARSGDAGIEPAALEELARRLHEGQVPAPRIVGAGDDAHLLVAIPVHYSRTPTPEGALLYRVGIADLEAGVNGRLRWDGDAAPTAVPGAASVALNLPDRLASLGLRAELNASSLVAPDWRAPALVWVAGVALASVLAGWQIRRHTRRVTSDLSQLADFARTVDATEPDVRRAPPGAAQEVVDVAHSVNAMLDRLSEQHRRLHDERELQFRAMLANLPGAVYRAELLPGDAVRYEYVSPGVRELFGRDADALLLARGPDVLVDAAERRRVRASIDQALARDEDFVVEYPLAAPDGTLRWIWNKGHASRDAQGRAWMHGVLIDISARRQIDQALREAKEQAESASRAKSQFLAMMSHEIRTPLNGVLGIAQLLQASGELSATARGQVDTLIGSGELLHQLLNDVLDLSRVEAGRLELHPRWFAPARLVADIVALCGPQARAKGLDLRTRWRGEPVFVRADPQRLGQMVLNLASNALKFTARGQVRVDGWIEAAPAAVDDGGDPAAEAHGDGAGELVIEVVDTGIGIAADAMPALFQPFSQVDASSTRAYGGSGLGLSIVARLAATMGGTVGCRSEPGAGATFTLRLPCPVRRSISDDVLATTEAGDDGPDESALRDHAFHILVADDNAVNATVVEAMLQSLGQRVSVVADGHAAADAAHRADAHGRRPDLVLMDCQMPGLDGFDASRLIRERERAHRLARVPIIALTAGAFDDDRTRCTAAGMDGYLAKPVSLQLLGRTIARFLVGGRSAAALPASVAASASPTVAPSAWMPDARLPAVAGTAHAAVSAGAMTAAPRDA